MASRKPATRPAPRTKAAPPTKAAKGPAKTAGAKAKPAAAGANGAPPPARQKHKLVRDSFTIPKDEYAALADLKQRATRLARPAKKSELLRAGIAALSAMSEPSFLAALNAVPSLKTGRPKDVAAPARKASTKKS